MSTIKLKRMYERPEQSDGIRILIDRLWPRGISKEEARLDYWLKDLGPSNELRKWFNHDESKFKTFKDKYIKELQTGEQLEAYQKLNQIIGNANKDITLLYASKEEIHNHAQVIKQLIQ